jgi:hypothetical protein
MTTTQLEPPSAPADSATLNALPDHRGQPRAKPVDFLVPPPPEIGPLSSAESSLRAGGKPKPLVLRLLMGTLFAGAIMYAFSWATEGTRPRDREPLMILGLVFAVTAFALDLYLTRFKALVTYVGRDGVSRHAVRRHRDATPKSQTLLFTAADALRAAQTRQFVNGIYTGTTYDYAWTGPAARRLFRLKGTYRGRKGPPKPGDPFHFATATEIAWSIHYLERAQEELDKQGSIRFNVDKNRYVHVGPGFLQFDFGGESPVRVTREEIAAVSLGSGQFSFKHKDAHWYSRSGKYNFRYGAMANARVFLLALDKLMGYRWT